LVNYTNITISGGADQGNYTLASTVGTAIADITPAPLSITAVDASKVYGETDPAFTVGYDGFVGEEDATVLGGTLTFSREPGEDVGAYIITPSGLTSGNYDITFGNGTLTITPLTINVTATENQSKTYGDADPELTYGFSPALIGDDTFTGALTRAVGEDVGTYAINQGTLALGDNYTLIFTGADFTITPLTINVTADALSKTYGEC
jgi:large repetitive protein